MPNRPKPVTHLEVMIGCCSAAEFAVIREFFEQRGYRISESRKGDVYRLWVEPPKRPELVQGRPRLEVTFPEKIDRARREAHRHLSHDEIAILVGGR